MSETKKSKGKFSNAEWKKSMLQYSKPELINALDRCNKAHNKKITALQKLDEYRKQYDIGIQMWDEVSIYVNRKNTEIESELTSIGGYTDFNEAVIEIVKILDRMNKVEYSKPKNSPTL